MGAIPEPRSATACKLGPRRHPESRPNLTRRQQEHGGTEISSKMCNISSRITSANDRTRAPSKKKCAGDT